MKSSQLRALGIPKGEILRLAIDAVTRASRSGKRRAEVRQIVRDVARDPGAHVNHPLFSELALALVEHRALDAAERPLEQPVPCAQWGADLDPRSVAQMDAARRLPVAVRGALMPDAHVGYGLPIGGVLAVHNAVIPYAVGVDIACRMKLSVLDLPPDLLDSEGGRERLTRVLERETRFGVGAQFAHRREHAVMDDDWSVSPVTRRSKDRAWSQLGTSGSGNHFAEFGTLELPGEPGAPGLGALPPGTYLALLSHSGSRGTGAAVADHYSKLAMRRRAGLPRPMRHLAWLDLDSEEGQEYWRAMQLMGRYAAANHDLIHRHVPRALGAEVLQDVENHHNFAWREQHDGRTVVVHRKGATPAGSGVLGVIPGSMASEAYVVQGLGNSAALDSASHGAGRRMSRKQARQALRWSDLKRVLRQRGVTLISAGLDEAPMAYKEIAEVMAAQGDLVRKVARFDPRLVKMAPGR